MTHWTPWCNPWFCPHWQHHTLTAIAVNRTTGQWTTHRTHIWIHHNPHTH